MRKLFLIGAAALLAAGAATAADAAPDNSEQPSEIWPDLRETLYGDRPVVDGAGIVTLDAPYRAHDPAVVPIEIRVAPPEGRRVAGLTLIVDENPAPVAATFALHEAMGGAVALTTRVRVNAYSNVRAVAELDDGTLMQSARFVKATGGCAAPASKDMAAALAALGKMKVRRFDGGASGPQSHAPGRREAQVMIRHPNNSGFQLDQVTQLYIPAYFIHRIEVAQHGAPIFTMTGGISLSEDPAIRFEYMDDGSGELAVSAEDTDGGVFEGVFAAESGS